MSDGHDQRKAQRYPVLGHAQILLPSGPVNCVVRDLSDTGAKLGVTAKARLPAEFYLWLVRRKLRLRVRLRWRRGDYAGVSFSFADALPDGITAKPKIEAEPSGKYVLDV